MTEALEEHGTKAMAAAAKRCKGPKKDGKPCQSTLIGADGYCVQHSPTRRFDPVEAGRKGGRRSALARRAHAKNGDGPTRDGRERLRHDFENDAGMYDKLKATYEGGLEAVTTCPACKERGLPDHRVRIASGDSFLAQIYGKPQQNIEAKHKHEHQIVVVSRTMAALEAADVDSGNGSNGEVIEYDEIAAAD